MTNEERPPIPEPIKREVRQRCGFGCVGCGLPIYHYDHMEEFAEVQEHVAENITLLCPNHHDEKTRGRLDLKTVREWNKIPRNVEHAVSAAWGLNFRSGDPTCEVSIGGCTISMPTDQGDLDCAAIVIDKTPLIGFSIRDGQLGLNLQVFDQFNLCVLVIADNELRYSTDSVWDITYEGNTLTLREAGRKILYEVSFDVPNRVQVNRARVLLNGVEVLVAPGQLEFGGGQVSIEGATGSAPCGLALGEPPECNGLIHFLHVPRYGLDRDASKQWVVDSFPE